jgi:hypothetical protein
MDVESFIHCHPPSPPPTTTPRAGARRPKTFITNLISIFPQKLCRYVHKWPTERTVLVVLEGWVAKQKDGWLRRRMGGKGEGWVAKERDGWLSRGMGG